MSTVVLRCDKCGIERQGQPGQSLEDLRVRLDRVGWRSSKVFDEDVCGTCVALGPPS